MSLRLEEPATKAAERIMKKVGGREVAVFVLAGKAVTTSPTGSLFEKHMKRHADRLVGVYNEFADFRAVVADLRLFA